MKSSLSVLIITKNVVQLIEETILSVIDIADEIIIVDNQSQDSTVKLIYQLIRKERPSLKLDIYTYIDKDLGKQRGYGLSKCSGDWVLMLDADEIVSNNLAKEIVQLLHRPNNKDGFYIRFQNHFLGKKIFFGGENYKILRLVKRNKAIIKPALVHERLWVDGETGILKNKIYHYSYRSLWQMYKKFTDYALRDAKQKFGQGEQSSLKKIFLYPIHMFWARFIKDQGYRDGLFRIPLDLGFAYMEWLTYVILFIYQIKNLVSLRFQPK